jgi:CBS-domain-containing membrane protein
MKTFEPILNGISAAFVIGVLSLLTFDSPFGVWLMFSFGSTAVILFVYHDSEFAKAKNVFFGHLISIFIGIIFNEYMGISFVSLGLSVGICVTLMMYLKIVHPPAAANPLIALFADVSYDFILFPVMAGSIVLIILSYFINIHILGRKIAVKTIILTDRQKNLKAKQKSTRKKKRSK